MVGVFPAKREMWEIHMTDPLLTLDAFRREKGWKLVELRRRLIGAGMNELSYETVRRAVYAEGETIPPPSLIVAAYRLSGGRVRPDSFYDLPPLPAPASAPDAGAAA